MTELPVQTGTASSSSLRWTGLLLLALLLGFGFAVPLVFKGDPAQQHLATVLQYPGKEFLLGTDHLGRDMLQRLAAAVRISVMIALVTTASAALFGVGAGMLAAVRGGWIDRAFSLLADTILALPGLLLVLLLVAITPGAYWNLYMGISLVLWVEFYRMSRAIVEPLARSSGVQASRLLGFGNWYVIRRHFWPELRASILTLSAFAAATSVLSVAALGFVHVGVRPPTPELGQMMTELLPYYQEAPYIFLQPILLLLLLVLGLNLLAGGKAHE